MLNFKKIIFKKLRCHHTFANRSFAGYHTAPGEDEEDDLLVFIHEKTECRDCGEKITRMTQLPPVLARLYFDNVNDCRADDPVVLAARAS